MPARKQITRKQAQYERTMRRALVRKSLLKSDGKYPSRDEAHDREQLRKHK
jgi:hypothetical protein